MSEPTNTRKIQIRVRDVEPGVKEVRASLIVTSTIRVSTCAYRSHPVDVMSYAKEQVRANVLHLLFGSIREQARKLFFELRRSYRFYSLEEVEKLDANIDPLLNAGDDWQVEEVSTVRFPYSRKPVLVHARPEEIAVEWSEFNCDQCGQCTRVEILPFSGRARCRCGSCGKLFEVEFYEAERENVGQRS